MLPVSKDAPSAGDVHVNGPLPRARLPKVIGQRTLSDVEDERKGDLRTGAGAVSKSFVSFCKVSGVDEGLGLVFGWGIICKEAGQDYVDLQGNQIPESAMVEAVTDFMKGERMAGEQHARMDAGTVVHSFPLTTDIANAMGVTSGRTGWMVAVAPDPAMLAKFKSGHLTGFSIGGEHIEIDGKPLVH